MIFVQFHLQEGKTDSLSSLGMRSSSVGRKKNIVHMIRGTLGWRCQWGGMWLDGKFKHGGQKLILAKPNMGSSTMHMQTSSVASSDTGEQCHWIMVSMLSSNELCTIADNSELLISLYRSSGPKVTAWLSLRLRLLTLLLLKVMYTPLLLHTLLL